MLANKKENVPEGHGRASHYRQDGNSECHGGEFLIVIRETINHQEFRIRLCIKKVQAFGVKPVMNSGLANVAGDFRAPKAGQQENSFLPSPMTYEVKEAKMFIILEDLNLPQMYQAFGKCAFGGTDQSFLGCLHLNTMYQHIRGDTR